MPEWRWAVELHYIYEMTLQTPLNSNISRISIVSCSYKLATCPCTCAAILHAPSRTSQLHRAPPLPAKARTERAWPAPVKDMMEHGWDGYLLSEYEGADKYDPGYEVGQMLRRHHIMMKNILGD